MKNFTLKSAFVALFLSASSALFSQNVAMNLSGEKGNPAAILDLSGNPNLGFLMPTVTLTSSTLASPISSPPAGLVVYNSSISTANGLSGAGFYYWSGTQWLYLITAGTSSLLTGSGTTSYLAQWVGPTALGTGITQDNGTGVGISTSPITPKSLLDVNGGVAIGSYAGNNAAPTNGVIVSGDMGIGTSTPENSLDVVAGIAVGSYAGSNTAPAGGMIVSGQVGVGTSSPNAAAALDVTSSTQGVLIPRMASNPTSTATGLMYYNTTTNCFVFWTGTAWQNMFCTCSGPPSVPGTINGATSYCPNATGVTYSTASVAGATYYTWSVPSGADITAGQGTNSITVNFGSASGSVSVTSNNNCATSAPNALPVTVNALPTISGQPTSSGIGTSGSGVATFTVSAIGAGLTYQWQVNTGSGFTALSNGGYYSGVTTPTLTVTNPISGMNGYQYDCVVSGSCTPGTTSNAATLTVGIEYIPITITNSQTTATTSNFVQMITVNSSTYSSYESSGLQNIEFTTGAAGGGSPLYAWIESGATSASTSTVYWVNLAASIGASSTYTIYMNFMPSAEMTSTTGYTGLAPQLFGSSYYATSYGQYDNGAEVFPAYFNGNTPTASIREGQGAGVNGGIDDSTGYLTATTDAGFEGATNFPASSAINVINFFQDLQNGQDAAFIYTGQSLPVSSGIGYIGESSFRIPANEVGIGVVGFFDGTSTTPANGISTSYCQYGEGFYQSWISSHSSSADNNIGSIVETALYGSVLWTGTSSTSFYSYIAPQLYSTSGGNSNSSSIAPLSAASHLYLGIHVQSGGNDGNVNINWMRARPNPPNNTSSSNTMPTVSLGSVQ